MTLHHIAQMFQKAARGVFHRNRLLLVCLSLFFSGIFFVFFRGIAYLGDGWWGSTLAFLPVFLALALMLAVEIVIVRLYANDGKVLKTLIGATDAMLRISYCSIPLLVLFLCTWMISGFFLLLRMIPYFGPVLGVILSFTPFVLHLVMIALALAGLYLIFVVAPTLALETGRYKMRLKNRLQQYAFYDLILFFVGFLPVWLVFKALALAGHLTFWIESVQAGSLEYALQSFFMMIPFVVCLAPVILFFFNFAAEVQLAFKQVDTTAQAQ